MWERRLVTRLRQETSPSLAHADRGLAGGQTSQQSHQQEQQSSRAHLANEKGQVTVLNWDPHTPRSTCPRAMNRENIFYMFLLI